MTSILELIAQIIEDTNCTVVANTTAASTLPDNLPEDLQQYFLRYGPIHLFSESDCPMTVVSWNNFQQANKVILDENIDDDITNNWFVIGIGPNSQYVSIDLSKARLGYCYDSFWDRYGLIGDMPIIAKSFSEFLSRLYQGGGNYYWLESQFESYGDAYDDV